VQAANTYYAYVHFPLTALILIWLSVRRPGAYKKVRTTLMALTGLALIGHTIFPLAPPRMLPGLGWVDTGIRFGQSVYGPNSDTGMANQFAAMPSLHVGWTVSSRSPCSPAACYCPAQYAPDHTDPPTTPH
jgi:hypothetical protein